MARYDDLNFNGGNYIPQYTGIPLEEITKTADTLSQRHYQNIAQASQLEILANQMKSKLLPGARNYVDGHIDSINAALQQMAADGGENSTAKISALANALQGDQGLLRGLEQAQAYDQFKKTRDTLTSQGLDPVWNKQLESQYLNAGITDPETGELNPLYNGPFNLTAEKRLNYMDQQDKVLDPLKPDAWEGELKEAARMAGMDVSLFLKSTKFQGLTSKKVQEYLFKPVKGPGGKEIQGLGWTSYKDSPEYRQQKMVGMSDEQIKSELQSRGEAKVFSQYDNSYMANPIADDLLRAGKKAESTAYPTLAPAQPVETLFNYNENGVNNSRAAGIVQLDPSKTPAPGGVFTMRQLADTGKNFDPQYIKDYKTMLEINGGDTSVKPESKEAKEAAAQYKQLVAKRVSNPYTQPISADVARDLNYELQSQYSLYEYMDPVTGKTFTAYDNEGKPTDEFIELTGGDPKKFQIESVYDAKNHYTIGTTANSKFVKPIAVVSQDEDGNPVRFLTSQLPNRTSPLDINTNAIYTKVNLRPGQDVELSARVKAREIHGAQLKQYIKTTENPNGILTPEQLRLANMPIAATIDGNEYLFTSPDEMAKKLEEFGINLSIK